MSVHREGVNPSSMDGVPDLRDHNSFGESQKEEVDFWTSRREQVKS